MKKETLGKGNCKFHNLPYVRGYACKTCEIGLQAMTNKLNSFFNGLVIDSDKNGNPVVYREK